MVRVLASDEAGVAESVRLLRAGGLVAIPTETVYGLGADASNPAAVARIFEAKGRPADHPLIVHVGDARRVDHWADGVPDWALVLGHACWPGPLTLIVPRRRHVSDVITGGRDTVGLRVPDHPAAVALLRQLDGIAAPSANRFGAVSPTTAAHVVDDLAPFLDELRDAVLDGGPCRVGIESTIVDATGSTPQILRTGAVTCEEVEAITGLATTVEQGGPARAPGMLAAHYAPRAEVIVIDAGEPIPAGIGRLAYLGPSRVVSVGVVVLDAPVPYDAARLAPLLYARLRQADDIGADRVVVQRPAVDGIGSAVIDRLLRAATGSKRS